MAIEEKKYLGTAGVQQLIANTRTEIAAAEQNAKDYADSLATNYDAAGSAATAESNAKSYTDAEVVKVNASIATTQGEVDALETYVGTFTHATAKSVVEYVDAKTAGIATEGAMTALADRVTAAEGDIDAIEADYLKAADKTELSDAIAAEKTRAEGIEASLQTQINTIMSNPDAEGAINSINEFTQYVADHGTIADGMRTDINKNKDDIAALNTEVAKKANAADVTASVTSLQEADSDQVERIAALEAKFTGEDSVADQITDAKTETLNSAKSYTDETVNALATGAVATNAADIDKLEASLAEGGATANAIAAAQKAGEDAAAEALTDAKAYTDEKDTAMNARVEALEAIDHDHSNKTQLDSYDKTQTELLAAAEATAKAYTDEKDTAMDTRVAALENVSYVEITADEINAMFEA